MYRGSARPPLLLAALPPSSLDPARRRELSNLLHLPFLAPSPSVCVSDGSYSEDRVVKPWGPRVA